MCSSQGDPHAWQAAQVQAGGEEGRTRGVQVTGFQCRSVGPQQLTPAVEHEGVDGRSQVHGCHSQILSACIHFSNVHDCNFHLAWCSLYCDWLHRQRSTQLNVQI